MIGSLKRKYIGKCAEWIYPRLEEKMKSEDTGEDGQGNPNNAQGGGRKMKNIKRIVEGDSKGKHKVAAQKRVESAR